MFVMCFDLFIVKAFYSSEAVDGILLRHVLCKETFCDPEINFEKNNLS